MFRKLIITLCFIASTQVMAGNPSNELNFLSNANVKVMFDVLNSDIQTSYLSQFTLEKSYVKHGTIVDTKPVAIQKPVGARARVFNGATAVCTIAFTPGALHYSDRVNVESTNPASGFECHAFKNCFWCSTEVRIIQSQ